MKPKMTICIVTYRRNADLMQSIHHLGKSTFTDFEILIVDNGASPDLRGLLEASCRKAEGALQIHVVQLI